jgi:hypothetical protein
MRLQELTKLIDELYILEGVDVSNLYTCNENSIKYGNTLREQNFIYYSLRVIADPSYATMVQKSTYKLQEE